MNLYVAVTDYEWFQLLASKPRVDEVNFWRPSQDATFRALDANEVLLFKLHSPRNFIIGGGFFTRFLHLPISLAWQSFGEGNGVRSLTEMRNRIGKYRRTPIGAHENPTVGCILLAEPFFFPESRWIPVPTDFRLNIVQGKGYDAATGTGRTLWAAVSERLSECTAASLDPGPATVAAVEGPRLGEPVLVRPRLGQGTFRVIVTDAYERRCAITGERTLPVLEAAHIRSYASGGPHDPENGLLLRRDLHALFDERYLTVNASDLRVVVSSRIREEFENGRDYYQLQGRAIRLPNDQRSHPSRAYLEFHNSQFR